MLRHLLLRYPALKLKDRKRGFMSQQRITVFRRDYGSLPGPTEMRRREGEMALDSGTSPQAIGASCLCKLDNHLFPVQGQDVDPA